MEYDANMTKTIMPCEAWTAPHVEVTEGLLRWSIDERKSRKVAASPTLLDSFLRLHSASDAQIGQFASRWGVLELCEHDLPARHRNAPGDEIATWASDGPCYPQGARESGFTRGWEPLEAWREFSRKARAVCAIARHLQEGRVGDSQDWATLNEDPHLGRRRRSVPFEKSLLMLHVDRWLLLGALRPAFRWQDDRTEIVFRPPCLFTALSLQLVFNVAKIDGIAFCCGCGAPYIPTIRPPAGRNNFCPTCGRKGAQRLAAQRYRARKREKRSRRRP
jgi:hypothetical protein